MSNPLARFMKGPFKADFMGGIVWSADQFHFADVRGWGQLGYKDDGEKIQDFHLQFMVDALNEKMERDADNAKPSSNAARTAYERLARYVGPQSEHRKNEGPLADVVLKELEEVKRELAWLRFYKKNVYQCLGPADDDINNSIRNAYVKEVGFSELPEKLRIEHEEYEADHRRE